MSLFENLVKSIIKCSNKFFLTRYIIIQIIYYIVSHYLIINFQFKYSSTRMVYT